MTKMFALLFVAALGLAACADDATDKSNVSGDQTRGAGVSALGVLARGEDHHGRGGQAGGSDP